MIDLHALAPAHLINLRPRRYHGDDCCLPLSALTRSDRHAIRELYQFLLSLFALLKETPPAERKEAVLSLLRQNSLDALVQLVTPLGIDSYRANPSPLIAKTVHDVRGGGLTPLIGQLQFLELDRNPRSADALYFLTRDHLKIMRNALLELDDAKREQDLLTKAHDTRMIAAKHGGTVLHSHGRSVHVEVECAEHVNISECCVEFGALDRILYNLLNNACRHAASEVIRLSLMPVPHSPHENLRLVLVNTVSEPDAAHLRTMDLATIFQYGVSTTGSGSGLSVAAEFVSNAFGLQSADRAIAGRYLGAQLVENQFAVWFHWPILADY